MVYAQKTAIITPKRGGNKVKNERGKVKGVMARWRDNVITSFRHSDQELLEEV